MWASWEKSAGSGYMSTPRAPKAWALATCACGRGRYRTLSPRSQRTGQMSRAGDKGGWRGDGAEQGSAASGLYLSACGWHQLALVCLLTLQDPQPLREPSPAPIFVPASIFFLPGCYFFFLLCQLSSPAVCCPHSGTLTFWAKLVTPTRTRRRRPAGSTPLALRSCRSSGRP